MDIMELIGLGKKRDTTQAEDLAVDALPSAALTGGLGGILAASALGGPVGLGVGVATGLIAQRFRQNEIERTAADIQSVSRFGSRIGQQLENMVPYAQEFGTEQDVSELGDIAASVGRLKELANHYDPQIRLEALKEMMKQDQRIDFFKQDLQGRTREESDRVWEARKERAAELRESVKFENEALTELAVSSESLLQMVNDLGIDSPAVQAKAREYANFTLAEAEAGGANVSLNLGIASASFNQLDYKFTEDEIYKMVAGRQKAVGDIRKQRIMQLQEEAQQDGFIVNQADGKWNVEDANLTIQNFRSNVERVAPLPQSSYGDTPRPRGRGAVQRASDAQGPRPDPIVEFFREQAEKGKEFTERNTTRRSRRRVN